MTTKNSPLKELEQQASGIAEKLKIISENPPTKDKLTFALVMDDKILNIEMSYKVIKEYSNEALIEYLVKQMREDKGH